MVKLIDRYIFLELLVPFSLVLSALMMILLTEQMVRLTELFLNKGVSLTTILKIFVYLLPAFLVIAIPMGVLIATIIGFSRLTADHEITALMAGGVGLFRLAAPVQVFTILAFVITFSLSVWAQPWIGRSMKTAAINLLKQEFSLGLEPGLFNETLEGMMIYVDEMPSPTRMKGIVIYDLRDAAQPTLILAQEGTLLSDPASDRVGLRLMNGSQHREIGGLPSTRPPAAAGPPDLPDRQAGGQEQESPSRYQWITFGRYEFKLDLAAVVKRASGEDGAAPNVRQLKEKFAGGQPMERRELRTLEEHYKTYAFPFSCLIFGMIGIPLGLAIKQGGRLGGFALGIAMALIYYLMMIIADFLATALVFTPLAAAWFPNLIMASLALFLAAGSNRGLFTRHGGFTRWFRSGGR